MAVAHEHPRGHITGEPVFVEQRQGDDGERVVQFGDVQVRSDHAGLVERVLYRAGTAAEPRLGS